MNKLVSDNLPETRNNLVKEITILSDTELNSKPDMDMWSIAQVCHHLVLVEKASIKAIAWGLKADLITPIERKNVHFIILDWTKKIKAPKIVEPDVAPFEVPQIIDLLNDSRENWWPFLVRK